MIAYVECIIIISLSTLTNFNRIILHKQKFLPIDFSHITLLASATLSFFQKKILLIVFAVFRFVSFSFLQFGLFYFNANTSRIVFSIYSIIEKVVQNCTKILRQCLQSSTIHSLFQVGFL